ncbi:OCIA domain-containing protein 1-like [Ctenocephalides felis]|uniref:OCIA domain-containing protein 1-like n=1 Tax=Ctenocephalides felis TaxID=7515 RepID=UPI000E6E1163|nr:OCIA domain-containing protein 1-like [Ctenocephalides felis]
MNSANPQHVAQETPNDPNPLANYQFSPDELRVLKQCNVEAFFERSLPLLTIFGTTTYMGVKRGFLSPSAKYGAIPKVLGAVAFGYFLGKFSYQNKCAQKLMQLPNSRLAQILRQRKFGDLERISIDNALGTSLTTSSLNKDVYTDGFSEQESVLDMDTDRPYQSGLDDTYRPNMDWNDSLHENLPPTTPPASSTTYEELRRKNREEYQKSRMQNYKGLVEDASLVKPRIQPTDVPPKPTTSNKYGDKWD